MTQLGTSKRPAVVRVQTPARAEEMLSLCDRFGWQVIVGVEPDQDDRGIPLGDESAGLEAACPGGHRCGDEEQAVGQQHRATELIREPSVPPPRQMREHYSGGERNVDQRQPVEWRQRGNIAGHWQLCPAQEEGKRHQCCKIPFRAR